MKNKKTIVLIILSLAFVSLAHAERYLVITTESPRAVSRAVRHHAGIAIDVSNRGRTGLKAMSYRVSNTIRYPEFQCAGQYVCRASGPRWFLAEAVAYAFGCVKFDSRSQCRQHAQIHNEVIVPLGRREVPWCTLVGYAKDATNFVTDMDCYYSGGK